MRPVAEAKIEKFIAAERRQASEETARAKRRIARIASPSTSEDEKDDLRALLFTHRALAAAHAAAADAAEQKLSEFRRSLAGDIAE